MLSQFEDASRLNYRSLLTEWPGQNIADLKKNIIFKSIPTLGNIQNYHQFHSGAFIIIPGW